MGEIQSSCAPCAAPAAAVIRADCCTASRVAIHPKGTAVDSMYNLEELLGDGGYSKVYRCVHKRSGENRACKSMDLSIKSNASSAKSEVDIMLRLQTSTSSRGILVRLMEVFEDDRFTHLIMELCAGGELYQRQSKIGIWTEQQAKCLVQQMLKAVAHLHKNFVVHRDLKLENWLFAKPEPSMDLRLCDFGLSIVLRPGQKASDRVGSVYYVAPEVLQSSYDQKADIWSIGIILFMMLSGLPPFNGPSPQKILSEVATGKLSFDAAIWTQISSSPRDVIVELLQRLPEKRPSADSALQMPWIGPIPRPRRS